MKAKHAPRHAHTLACVLFAWSALAWAQAPAPPPAPRFAIQQYLVEGNTLLPQDEVARILAPHAGTSRDFGDVQRALEALQDAYSARGFTAVRVLVPEQDIRAGQVRLQVIEARLRNVKVEGNQFFDTPNVRAGLPSVREGASPNTREISRNAQLVNENPAKQVSVALEAADEDAKVDAIVRVVDDKPARYSAFLDNSGTAATGYYRAGVGFQHANLFNRDHVFNAQFITSPDHIGDVTIFGLGYRVPVYKWNGAFDVFGGYSNVNSGTVANLFNVSGVGTVFGARYTQILPRINTYEQKLAFGWDYRDIKSNVTFVGTTGTIIPDLTIQPLSLTYTGRFLQVGRDLSFFGSLSHNFGGGADGNQAAFAAQPRFLAQQQLAVSNYTIWRAGASLSQALPADYLLRVLFNAQYTRNPLVTSEQFGMGGADSVRGFLEREVANDIGHRFSLEGYTPDFGKYLGTNWRARALAFVDMARGYDRDPAARRTGSLASGWACA